MDSTWREMVVVGQLHDFPKHSEKFLPKYDPDTKESQEDHVSKFMLAVSLMVVEHEYVVCILFPFTFEGKTSTWYFPLPQGSITNWNEFKTKFLKNFGEDKTPTTLVLELSKLK
jgi:hypothetical protein